MANVVHRPRLAVLVAAGSCAVAAPAAAISVFQDIVFSIDDLSRPFTAPAQVTSLETSEALDPLTSIAIESDAPVIEPVPGTPTYPPDSVGAGVLLEELGEQNDTATLNITATNLTDEAVRVILPTLFDDFYSISFDQPVGLQAVTDASVDFLLPVESNPVVTFEGLFDPAPPEAPGDAISVSLGGTFERADGENQCLDGREREVDDPCSFLGGGSGTLGFDLAAGEALAFSVAVTATASVSEVAPIPLPAAAPAAALILGGMTWAARRRRAA